MPTIYISQELENTIIEDIKRESQRYVKELKEKYERKHPGKIFEDELRKSRLGFIGKRLAKIAIYMNVKNEHRDDIFFDRYKHEIKTLIDDLVEQLYSPNYYILQAR